MDFKQARQAIVDEHKAMEKHDPFQREEAERAKRAGEPTLCQRPIGFLCDDEVVVVGDCVETVIDGLNKFLDLCDSKDSDLNDRAGREPVVAQAIAKSKKVLENTGDELRVPTQTWNALMFALGEVGVKAVLTEGRDNE